MRALRILLAVVLALGLVFYFRDVALATSDERAVLSVVGSKLLNEPGGIDCLATWTSIDEFPGSYSFVDRHLRPGKDGDDTSDHLAKGRPVILYAGAPPSRRPVFISRAVDMAVGCALPTRLSTPIFAGDFAFVSARTDGPIYLHGVAFALRRTREGWAIIDSDYWDGSTTF